MKRLILGFAACALIMSSCTQQEITENVTDGQGQLSFSTGLGKQSARAAELINSTLKTAANGKDGVIALRAYQETETTPGTFKTWYNDKLWYDTEWKIESVRFRNEAKTKYITYFSKAAGLLSEVDGTFAGATFVEQGVFPQFTYKVNTGSNDQEDLLAGVTEIPANQTNITLGMRHILSQVNFGTVGYKGANIAIRNIKIAGLYNSATYTYRAKDTYPIGDWGTLGTDKTPTRTATYNYFDYSNVTKDNNPQPVVPYTVESAGIYIFGDGGNWGPGKAATTFYPVGTDGDWTKGDAAAAGTTKLANSLMLMPQSFMADATDAKVTFEYQITDKDDVFIAGAGSATEWAKGEFKLDFTTGTVQGEHYLGKWDQNYRYIYLIDFTDFLDGNALTFTVDVEMYPWENYNGDGDDDGIVDIMAAGQPSATNMDTKITNENTWYIATQSKVQPTTPTTPPTTTKTDWAQVIRDETWNLSAYNFTQIVVGEGFNLSFQNVIFNTKGETPTATEIALTLPDGFSANATSDASIDITGDAPTYKISKGKRDSKAAITITNDGYYRTAGTLMKGIQDLAADKEKLGYGGKEKVDLTLMQPISSTVSTFTVRFNCLITPTIGATTDGTWVWDSTTQTATWTKKP